MQKWLNHVWVFGLALIVGFIAGSWKYTLATPAYSAISSGMPQEDRASSPYQPNRPPTTDLVFQREPGPDVPTLQEMTAGATTDDEALAMVVSYYRDNRERLRTLWREENETRLAGIFSMYVVHISHIYGETDYPTSFLEYLRQPRAHCGTYSVAQTHIAQELGLTWRMFELTSGWHGWVEILVDGQWEIFDATTNQWISRSGLELLEGTPREYRSFYTPLLDMDRPDARLHLAEGYNMEAFRVDLPGLGLFYNPPGEPVPYDPSRWY